MPQRYKTEGCHWSLSDTVRWDRLRSKTNCGDPHARTTTGLVAYLDSEPVGWAAVDPRTEYPRLRRTPTVWRGRQEDSVVMRIDFTAQR